MERITITIDDDLLATVDTLMARRGYPSRSEAIRELVREAAKQDYATASKAPCVATLSYVFDHATRDLSQRLVNAQHERHDLGVASTHVHFDHDSCLEIEILRGPIDVIQKFSDSITSQRGVRHPYLHIIPIRPTATRHSHEPGTPPHSHATL